MSLSVPDVGWTSDTRDGLLPSKGTFTVATDNLLNSELMRHYAQSPIGGVDLGDVVLPKPPCQDTALHLTARQTPVERWVALTETSSKRHQLTKYHLSFFSL